MFKVRNLGLVDYQTTWNAMLEFTDSRSESSPDEIWVLQHNPVFTQGRSGKPEHILSKTSIPVVQSDRGGQVTYHGPGQLVVYTLLDLNRLGIGVKTLVCLLEQSIIKYLVGIGIEADTKKGSPGVYVGDKKIAALGLRVRKARTLHGVSLNIDMDLSPFNYINPCGYAGLEICQIKDWIPQIKLTEVADKLVKIIDRFLREHYVSKAN